MKTQNKHNNLLEFLVSKISKSAWQWDLKTHKSIQSWLLKVARLLDPNFNRGDVIFISRFAKQLSTLYNASGYQGVTIYLRACFVLTQQAAGGQVIPDTTDLKVRVSRTKTGYPRLIPALHRKMIRNGNKDILRLWLTLFGLYRIVPSKGSFSVKTIVTPFQGHKSMLKSVSGYMERFVKLYNLEMQVNSNKTRSGFEGLFTEPWAVDKGENLKEFTTLHLFTGYKPFPIHKTGPGGNWETDFELGRARKAFKDRYSKLCKGGIFSSSQLSRRLQKEYQSLKTPSFSNTGLAPFQARALVRSPVWPSFIDVAMKTGQLPLAERLEGLANLPFLKDKEAYGNENYLGKLSIKLEPAKVRVFAMVDYWTQTLLAPFHTGIYRLLRVFGPCDGTHDQDRSVAWAASKTKGRRVYSFDLSAATDRLPMPIQVALINQFKQGLGDSWATLLTERTYKTPSFDRIKGLYENGDILLDKSFLSEDGQLFQETLYPKFVKYGIGQPMGAYSSWGMLALTHHAIVNYAFELAYGEQKTIPKRSFYAILGDDIIIWDSKVAHKYLSIMEGLGVELNKSKSLRSTNGSSEFAKRFVWMGSNINLLSMKEAVVAPTSLGALVELYSKVSKYGISLSHFLIFAGFGFRNLSKLGNRFERMGRRLKNLLVYFSNPLSPVNPLTKIPSDWLSMISLSEKLLLVEERSIQSFRDRYLDPVLKGSKEFILSSDFFTDQSVVVKPYLQYFEGELIFELFMPVLLNMFEERINDQMDSDELLIQSMTELLSEDNLDTLITKYHDAIMNHDSIPRDYNFIFKTDKSGFPPGRKVLRLFSLMNASSIHTG